MAPPVLTPLPVTPVTSPALSCQPLDTPALLRKRLRQQRRQLPARQQRQAETAILNCLRQQPCLRLGVSKGNERRIGLYAPAFGEVPTGRIANWLRQRGFQVYLPEIRRQHLRWQRLRQHWPLSRRIRHRWGMIEVKGQRPLQTAQLHILILPLLAFDQSGNRLGMGGGFYDRALAHLPVYPWRLGLAYDFQRVATLPVQPWDQGLDAVVTPESSWQFRRKQRSHA